MLVVTTLSEVSEINQASPEQPQYVYLVDMRGVPAFMWLERACKDIESLLKDSDDKRVHLVIGLTLDEVGLAFYLSSKFMQFTCWIEEGRGRYFDLSSFK